MSEASLTDRTGPAIVLVEPQLGENIGTTARAMANFGLTDLRLVEPREGWPNEKARTASSGADHVLDRVRVYPTVETAVADLGFLYATTARSEGRAPARRPRRCGHFRRQCRRASFSGASVRG